MKYRVNDMYTSIQGEGVQTGLPMHIVRLHGCNVGCPWCDTKETWGTTEADKRRERSLPFAMGQNANWCSMTAHDVADYVSDDLAWSGAARVSWVLLTGGEPGQQKVEELVKTLQRTGFSVACETSATATGVLGANIDWLTVSPKIGMPGGLAIIPEVLEAAHEIKHVVGRIEDYDKLTEMLGHVTLRESCQICLQPVSRSEKATQLCTQLCVQHGHRLSIQTHLMAGLR